MELKDWHSSKDMVKSLRCLWKPNHALFPKTEYDIKRQPLQEPLNFPQRHFLKDIAPIAVAKKYAGIGVSMVARIKNTRTLFGIDFGIGDVIVPKQEKLTQSSV